MHTVIELLTRTLCDVRSVTPADAAYLFCQTSGNESSLFQAAKDLVTGSTTSKILILKTDAKSGYPGYSQWKQRLQAMGLDENQVEGVTIEETPIIQTRIESEALIRHARQKGYTALIVSAPPFQQLRAFMTAATVAIKEYPELSIYSYPGAALPWQEWVVHSQGTLEARRSELIRTELERIHTYQKKGHLAPFEQILTYLNHRE
jgi:hypothetical protein